MKGTQKSAWHSVSDRALANFAQQWLLEIRGESSMPNEDIGLKVTMMNFTAPPDTQWRFILSAIAQAQSDKELEYIAAGPLEHILGHHGDHYIALVGEQSRCDPKFARTLTGVWQYLMTDAIWARVRAIQGHVLDPLKAYRP